MGYEYNCFLRELKEFSCSSPHLKSGGGVKLVFFLPRLFLVDVGMRSNQGLAIFEKLLMNLR